MSYKQWLAGLTDKVLAIGRVAYGGDGTNLYPLNVESDGQLQIDVLSAGVAGTARLGTVSGVLKTVSVVTTLASTAGAYVATDVMGAVTTGGAAWLFAEVARADGGYGYITKAVIDCEHESITPRITMFLFNAAPANCELDDADVNTAPDCNDSTKYVGKIDFPALDSVGTTDSTAIATPSTVGNLPLAFKCADTADDLHAVVVTRDAATITAGDDLTIALTVEQY